MDDGVGRQIAGFIRAALVIGIAYTVASALLSVLGAGGRAESTVAPAAAAPAAAPASFDLTAVSGRHLFGEMAVQDAAEAAVGALADLPDTRLPLELHGVFVDQASEQSAAIIAEKNRPGLLYPIGVEVPGNATLIEVHAQFVLLRRGPVVERLGFADSLSGVTADAEASPAADGSEAASPAAVSTQRGPRQARAFLEAQREQFEADPAATLSGFGIAPVVAGEAAGYRLGSLANASYLSQTGLKSGDIVVSIDGQPLGLAENDRQQLAALLEQGLAKLEVRRGTRRFFVTVSLR